MLMLINGLGERQMDKFSNLKASSMRIQNILNTRTQKLDMLYVYLKKEHYKSNITWVYINLWHTCSCLKF